MIRRKIRSSDHDQGYKRSYGPGFNITENYFPVTSTLAIVDESRGRYMALVNDRSMGGSSLGPGKLELMQHRRIFARDNLGAGEYLNELDRYGHGVGSSGKYYLVLDHFSRELPLRVRNLVR